MNRLLRRQLVSSAVLGRARQAPASTPATAAPFMGGVVVRIQGSTILAATRDGDVLLDCEQARVWKGAVVGLAACQPGDFFYARGMVTNGATFRTSHLWLNIVNIVGIVEQAAGDEVFVRHTHLGVRVLDRVSRVIIDGATERFQRHKRRTQAGDYVQVVGVQTSLDTIRATRMWG